MKPNSFRPRRRAGLGLALSTLAWSACVGYAPDPLEPHEALAGLTQRTVTDLRVEPDEALQPAWFPLESEVTIADGLSLGEANALALFYSPAIRAARADARVAGAQVLQAGVLANPSLFLGPLISTQDSAMIFPAGLSWELPLWGELDAERDVAAAQLNGRSLAVLDVELETLMQVRSRYLRLDRLQRAATILDDVATSSQQIVQWVDGLRAAGELDAVAGYLARSERDEAGAAIAGVRAEAVRTRRELLALLGLLPDAPVKLAADGTSAVLPELPAADADALLALPELRAAEAAYATAEAALRLEISRQYPSVRLGPEFESDRGDPMIGLGLGITLPLFDRNRGNIAAAAESRQRARENYNAALLDAAHAAARARDDLALAEQVLQIHREGAMRDAEAALRTLDLRLRAGRADVVEVLAAQRAIARTRARMLELEEQAAVARLRAAVAGGLALVRPSSAQEEEPEGGS